MPDPANKTPFADSPLSKNGAEIARSMFSTPKPIQQNGVQISVENDVDVNVVYDLEVFIDRNRNHAFDTDEMEFSIFVFVSKDASYLQEAFDKTDPADDEICIYLENNEGDLVSDQATWIRIGNHLRSQPKRLRAILGSESVRSSLPIGGLFSEDAKIDELAQQGFLDNASRSIALALLSGMQQINYPVFYVGDKIGQGLLAFTKWLRPLVKFSDEHWDPEQFAKAPTNRGKEFAPIFFPFSNQILDQLFDDEKRNYGQVIATLRGSLAVQRDHLASKLNQFGKFKIQESSAAPGNADLSPPFMSELIRAASDALLGGVDALLGSAESFVPQLEYLGKRVIVALNAFYCGLWNSLVEAVLGLVDIIGYLLRFLLKSVKMYKDFPRLVPKFKEMLDELIQSALSIDVGRILNVIIQRAQTVSWDALSDSFAEKVRATATTAQNLLSVVNVAYFLGAFVGFLIDVFVGIAFTAGAATVATLARWTSKGAKFFAAMFSRLVKKLVPKGLGRGTTRELPELILGLIQSLLKFFKGGTEQSIAFIRRLFDELAGLTKISKEKLAAVIKNFRLSKSDLNRLKRIGYEITDSTGGVAKICKIIP
ncbi:MAG: hypothetical protein AAFN77_04320 [Planctomycetota bacterium]